MEKYVQKNLFGKLLDYEVEENVININFEGKKTFVKIINSYIINFFVPLQKKSPNRMAWKPYLSGEVIILNISTLNKLIY